MPRVAAVIPAFNEARTIAEVAKGAALVSEIVIVVDDGSTDGTATSAQLAGVIVHRRARNGGKGAALRDGYRMALEKGAEIVVTLDADGQHDPSDITRLVGPIAAGDADVVVGARTRAAETIPAHRRAGQQLFRRAAQLSGGVRVTDTESGFRAFDSRLLRRLDLREDGYATEWETIVAASKLGARIVEVPIRANYAVENPSKANPVRQGWDVSRGILRFVRHRHPLAFFALPGLTALLIGVLLGVQTAQGYYVDGVFWPGKAMLAMLGMLLGAVLLLAGLVLDALADIRDRLEARAP